MEQSLENEILSKDLESLNCHQPCKDSPLVPADHLSLWLQKVPGWAITENQDPPKLHRKWTTTNFVTALDFVNKIGEVAETQNHHPDISIKGWNNVEVEIYTHSLNAIAENDFIIAAHINTLPVSIKRRRKKKKRT
eukprot:TRINITY_DN630_c0_g1_i2.p1 TRINITY_DN630_c0_g1~~TRINITY_DN630_c0_g1_i2.p1  ORF type:complete len:136 (+),score=28.74 TRINITY_DN630_c0_g1_i2:62-469(+)